MERDRTGGRRGGREAPCSEKKPKTLESIRYQIRREYRYVAFKLCHVGGVIISYPCRLSGLCHSYPAFVISCETNAADTRHRGEITYSASNFLAVSPGEPKPSTQLNSYILRPPTDNPVAAPRTHPGDRQQPRRGEGGLELEEGEPRRPRAHNITCALRRRRRGDVQERVGRARARLASPDRLSVQRASSPREGAGGCGTKRRSRLPEAAALLVLMRACGTRGRERD